MTDPERFAPWESQGIVSKRNGRSFARVLCKACGWTSRHALWSWAGNGSARCKGCRKLHHYFHRELPRIPQKGRESEEPSPSGAG